jgi:protein-L-isoaspartate(D-aspartate) O-methyltransferase
VLTFLDTLPDHAADWMDAFRAVPREAFIPDTVWRWEDGRYAPLRRDTDPAAWQAAVTADAPVITQVDDGVPDGPGHCVSSSSSMPTVMAIMLAQLEADPGHKVLEIGTGTGWNSALLAHRLGAEQVTSIEVDPALAEQARGALKRAGYPVTVITGDGALGVPERAPFDRIIATAGVSAGQIPYEWVKQARPGGRIVVPWGTCWLNAGMLALTVAEDGTASGQVVDHAAFMSLRAQRVDRKVPPCNQDDAVGSITDLYPGLLTQDYDGCAFAASLRLADVEFSITLEPDHTVDQPHFETLLWHAESGSWALHTVTPEADRDSEYPVRQWGPRRLWDEAETAYDWWDDLGRPDYRRFGVTVTPARQWAWLDEPANVVR